MSDFCNGLRAPPIDGGERSRDGIVVECTDAGNTGNSRTFVRSCVGSTGRMCRRVGDEPRSPKPPKALTTLRT